MIAAPWYLLSAGIVVLLIGYFMAALSKPEGRQPPIDPRLRDDEIAEALQGPQGGRWAGLVILIGGVLIFVSVVWRLLRLLF